MNNSILSQNLELIYCFKDSQVVTIKRQLYKNDPIGEDFDRLADGSIEFTLDNSIAISNNFLFYYKSSCNDATPKLRAQALRP